MRLHLAQYNIATLRRPLDDAASATYVALLDEVNALAEASAGFVWRHGIDSRDTSTNVYENPLTLVNMSVWESPEHLKEYAYRGFHRDVFRRRAEWFDGSGAVMWWIEAGSLPTLGEGVERLDFLGRHGPTPFAFETGQRHPQFVIVERAADPPDVAASVPTGMSEVSGVNGVNGVVHVAVLDGHPVGAAQLVDVVDGVDGVDAAEDAAAVGTTGRRPVRTWTVSDEALASWLEPALETHARVAPASRPAH